MIRGDNRSSLTPMAALRGIGETPNSPPIEPVLSPVRVRF